MEELIIEEGIEESDLQISDESSESGELAENDNSELVEEPDSADQSSDIVESADNVDAVETGSEASSSDYSVQIAQIIDKLTDAYGDTSLEDIRLELVDLNDNQQKMNENLITIGQNAVVIGRVQVGILLSIWASIIIYIAFSKLF